MAGFRGGEFREGGLPSSDRATPKDEFSGKELGDPKRETFSPAQKKEIVEKFTKQGFDVEKIPHDKNSPFSSCDIAAKFFELELGIKSAINIENKNPEKYSKSTLELLEKIYAIEERDKEFGKWLMAHYRESIIFSAGKRTVEKEKKQEK